MNKDTVIAGLVAIIVLLIGGFAIWNWALKPLPVPPPFDQVSSTPLPQNQQNIPTTNQTAANSPTVKSYSDSQYGFSFTYPSNLSVEDMYGSSGISGRKFLLISNKQSPFDRLEINVTSSAYGASAGREACGKGYDNQTYSNVTINGLNFTKGEVGSAYQGMNSGKINATAYCYTDSTTGNQYVLSHVGTPSVAIQSIINSFKLK